MGLDISAPCQKEFKVVVKYVIFLKHLYDLVRFIKSFEGFDYLDCLFPFLDLEAFKLFVDWLSLVGFILNHYWNFIC